MMQFKSVLRWCTCAPMLCVAAFLAPQTANAEIEAVDGVYQLTSGQDLAEFATLVNGSENKAIDAVLTTDIDMAGVGFTPIGAPDAGYCGTFDGQGYTISNLVVNMPDRDYVGVFGAIAGGAQIMNFVVDSSCSFTGKAFVGVVGGYKADAGSFLINRIGSEADFTGSAQNVAGIFGVNMNSSASGFVISNCYTTGKITGARESAAITGWAQNGTVTNCYSISEVSGNDANQPFFRGAPTSSNNYSTMGQVTQITLEDAASGKLTYALNGNQELINYAQTLGTHTHPVLFDAELVYMSCSAGVDCAGRPLGEEFEYTNTEVVLPPHDHVDGVCTVCGHVDPNGLQPAEDGVYEIANGTQLYWIAWMNYNVSRENMDVRLVADIDYTPYNMMIGDQGDHEYNCVFDGQGHTIKVNLKKEDGTQNCALFGSLYNATIKNLRVEGNVESNGKYAAGLASHTYGACVIENVVTDVNILSHLSGDATNAGLLAVAENDTQIKNCVVLGSQSTDNGTNHCGGIVGWSSGISTIENVLVVADITVGDTNSNLVSRNIGNANTTNVFFTKPFASTEKATQVSEDEVASGALAYTLGWGQEIGVDAVPSPICTHTVYKYGSQLTNTHKPAMEAPVLSTPEAPVFYYIKNARSNKYVQYTGGTMNQVDNMVDYANMFYFVAAGEAEGDYIPVTIHNAVAGGKTMTNFGSWGGENTRWYIHTNPGLSENGLYIGTVKETGNNAWWNDHGQSTVGSWSCDGGSIWQFQQVAIEDAPEMAMVIYNHVLNGQVMKTEQAPVMVGQAYPAPSVPAFVNAQIPEGTVEASATVDLNVEVVTPFEASTDFANAKWYQVINNKEASPRYFKYDGPDATEYHITETASVEDQYLWSFYGNPYEGYKIMNLAAGEGKYLNVQTPSDGAIPLVNENEGIWTLDSRNAETFGLSCGTGWWMNRHGGLSYTVLKIWTQGSANDLGSSFCVEEVDIDARYTVYDATPTQIAARNGVTMLSTVSEIVLGTVSGTATVAEGATVTVYDYFADKTFEIAPVAEGNKVKITLPEAYTSSALLYVTLPADIITMDAGNTNVADKLTYYVHGSEIISEEAIQRVMALIAGGETAIEGVVAGQNNVDVYSVNGAAVMKGANASALKGLKGIYIVNGKKVILK